MTKWIIELVGGPRDGEILVQNSRLPLEWRVPMLTSSIQYWLEETETDPTAAAMPTLLNGRYKVRRDTHGVHSMTDEGHVLFDWEGTA